MYPPQAVLKAAVMKEVKNTSVLFFNKTPYSCLNTEKKKSNNSQVRDILQSMWPVLLKSIKVTKKGGKFENYHSQEDPKAIRQPNAIWCPEWDPGPKKWMLVKMKTIWIKYGIQLKIMCQYWFMNCHASTILTWEIDSGELNVKCKSTVCPVFTTLP